MHQVHDQTGLAFHEMRLIFGGKQLQPDRMLAEYDVQKGSTLHVVLRMFGGAEDYIGKRGSAISSGISQELIKVNPR